MNLSYLLVFFLFINLSTAHWLPETFNSSHSENERVEMSALYDHACCDTEVDHADYECLSHCFQMSTLLIFADEIAAPVFVNNQTLRQHTTRLISSPVYALFRPPIA